MNYLSFNRLFYVINPQRFIGYRGATSKSVKTIINAQGKDVPKKRSLESMITLIGPDNSVSITNLTSAQSLSIRRDLKLVKIQDEDSKSRRPVYKLMTTAEYHAEEILRRKEKQLSKQNNKVEKLITLSSRIAEHDLMTGIKKMIKLVDKEHEVRVVITGEDSQASEKMESIYSIIEGQVKSKGKIVQKRSKGNSLRFQLVPLNLKSGQDNNKNSNANNNDKGPL